MTLRWVKATKQLVRNAVHTSAPHAEPACEERRRIRAHELGDQNGWVLLRLSIAAREEG